MAIVSSRLRNNKLPPTGAGAHAHTVPPRLIPGRGSSRTADNGAEPVTLLAPRGVGAHARGGFWAGRRRGDFQSGSPLPGARRSAYSSRSSQRDSIVWAV